MLLALYRKSGVVIILIQILFSGGLVLPNFKPHKYANPFLIFYTTAKRGYLGPWIIDHTCGKSSKSTGEFYIEEDEIGSSKTICAIACLEKSNCRFADFVSNESPFTCKLYKTCENWNNLSAMGHILFRKGTDNWTLNV